MTERHKIKLGMVAGALWSLLLLWAAGRFVNLPVFTLMPTIMTAFLAPGLLLIAMVGRLAQRRFFDTTAIEGAPLSGAVEIDQRVLSATVEQMVLALCVWPAAAVILGSNGPGVIVSLGLGFVVTQASFWIGCHTSAPLRVFGFAASFFPTVFVALWTLRQLAFGFL